MLASAGVKNWRMCFQLQVTTKECFGFYVSCKRLNLKPGKIRAIWVFVMQFGLLIRSERREKMYHSIGMANDSFLSTLAIGLQWQDIMMGLIVYGCANSCNHLMLLGRWRSPRRNYWNQRLVLMASWAYMIPSLLQRGSTFKPSSLSVWETLWARHCKLWTDWAHHREL